MMLINYLQSTLTQKDSNSANEEGTLLHFLVEDFRTIREDVLIEEGALTKGVRFIHDLHMIPV